MKYVLMLADPPGSWDAMTPAEQQRIMDGHRTFAEALVGEKKMAGGFRLRPIARQKRSAVAVPKAARSRTGRSPRRKRCSAAFT